MSEPLLEAFFQLDAVDAGAVRAFCQRHGTADNIWWPQLGPFPGDLPFRVQDEALEKLSPTTAARLEAEWQERVKAAGEARAKYLGKLRREIIRQWSYTPAARTEPLESVHAMLDGWSAADPEIAPAQTALYLAQLELKPIWKLLNDADWIIGYRQDRRRWENEKMRILNLLDQRCQSVGTETLWARGAGELVPVPCKCLAGLVSVLYENARTVAVRVLHEEAVPCPLCSRLYYPQEEWGPKKVLQPHCGAPECRKTYQRRQAAARQRTWYDLHPKDRRPS
jgi:hypothetical protein